MELVEDRGELGCPLLELLVKRGELGRRDAAAVPGDAAGSVVALLLCLVERTLRPDHLLCQRTHVGKRRVRLVRSEGALGHGSMIGASWAPVNGFKSRGAGSAPGKAGGARPRNRDACGVPGYVLASWSCGSRRRRGPSSASSSGAGRRSGRPRSSPGWCSSRTAIRGPIAGTIPR